MLRLLLHVVVILLGAAGAAAQSTTGIEDLVQRRLPAQADQFVFALESFQVLPTSSTNATTGYDAYTISTSDDHRILIQGESISALASGLHRYLTDVVHVDIWWFVGSRLDQAPSYLPRPAVPILGQSIVKWRYHFNTVTFSYTSAFWTWDDWELQLDWMALHGINLPLAWVGVEKILSDVFLEAGFTKAEVKSFFSSPAFQSWNRFGNIQGSWGPSPGELPDGWIEGQFQLQKQIVARMVELGMTPVLPSFTGFVPRAAPRVFPEALIVNGSQWVGFPEEYTNVTFLEPGNDEFQQLQQSFISKQKEAYGDVSSVYTLDQYNENEPYSGDPEYLRNISSSTLESLKSADPEAIWLMQGWLFFISSTFWTDERVEAYLGGVENDEDMIILDLFSESNPQWQRTHQYYGKPWIWCQLHNFGGAMGLYGQISNLTIDPIEALEASSNLVGFGLTPEAQEGNEIVYNLLLDQAWSRSPISTSTYFANWVTRRYAGDNSLPGQLFTAWEILRTSVYSNTNLTACFAVCRSGMEARPSIQGVTDILGSSLTYDPNTLREAWELMASAAADDGRLWANPAFAHDMVDVSRQVIANTFVTFYDALIDQYNTPNISSRQLNSTGNQMIDLLSSLDNVLATSPNFQLSTWLQGALDWASSSSSNTPSNTSSFFTSRQTPSNSSSADLDAYFTYSARNQLTLWGPTGQISGYATKVWAGLVSTYYVPRWRIFVDYIVATPHSAYDDAAIAQRIRTFELEWQDRGAEDLVSTMGDIDRGSVQSTVLEEVGRVLNLR